MCVRKREGIYIYIYIYMYIFIYKLNFLALFATILYILAPRL